MSLIKGIFVTINTDAGFSYKYKIGTFAYWVKGHGIHLKGSGVLKEKCTNPWECEMKAMINALHVLKRSNHAPIIGFIFNRDSKTAYSKQNGNLLQKLLYKEIQFFKHDAINVLGITAFESATKKQNEYAIFRHVEGHSEIEDKRSWVNRWLDTECTRQLENWKKHHKKKTKQQSYGKEKNSG